MATVSLVLRAIIGGIFLVSGLAKISDPIRFLLTLREFRLFPEAIVPFAAVFVPWLEFILGLSLILGVLHRTGALMIAGLNMLFIFAIGSVIIRGIEVDCGCFGLVADILNLPDMADWKAVVRNVFFVAMCIAIYTIKNTSLSLERYIRSSR
ncbi:MAG TPA: MauE/DoxX family redox-associated membrane protein [Thermodesulfovibrionales bacterium]|nr:MauE/DoxX family redox-associated membrane protein [Thermodesulfovibrionales bacterium]